METGHMRHIHAYPIIPRGDIYSLYMFDGLVSLYFFHL